MGTNFTIGKFGGIDFVSFPNDETEFRQLELGHLNFGNVEFTVEFRNFSKFQGSFDSIGEFL